MARRPRLAVLGPALSADQIGLAAARLKWKIVAPASADLVYVTAGWAGDLAGLAVSGPPLAVDIGLVAELGRDRFSEVVAASPGRVRRGEPLASAPAVRAWFGSLRETRGIAHMSGLCTSPDLAPSMLAVALYGARSAGWTSAPSVEALHPGRVALRFPTASDERVVSVDLVGSPGQLPLWELQAASPDRVVRVALLPEPRIEVNGAESRVSADHPVHAFGHESFLRAWWQAVQSDTPARHDPVFVDTVSTAMALVADLSG